MKEELSMTNKNEEGGGEERLDTREEAYKEYTEKLMQHWLKEERYTHFVHGPETLYLIREGEEKEGGTNEITPIAGHEQELIELEIDWLKKMHPQGLPKSFLEEDSEEEK